MKELNQELKIHKKDQKLFLKKNGRQGSGDLTADDQHDLPDLPFKTLA